MIKKLMEMIKIQTHEFIILCLFGNIIYSVQENGFCDTANGVDFFERVLAEKNILSFTNIKKVLIHDSYGVHLAQPFQTALQQNNIISNCIPTGATSYLQPLNR